MSQTEDTSIPLFVSKLFQMLQCNDHADIIQWQPENKGFKIKSIRHLENRVLPKYFRHGNYTSFVRQLNMYDFHKVKIQDDSVFAHNQLTQLNKNLLFKIKRKCYKKQSDKENIPSTHLVRFAQPIQLSQPIKVIDVQGLIDQLIHGVRQEMIQSDAEPRKIIYQLRKTAKFKPIRGSKYLSRIYEALELQRQKDDQLEELSIQQVILYQDKIIKMNSLAYLQSEAIFIKAQTEGQFECPQI